MAPLFHKFLLNNTV